MTSVCKAAVGPTHLLALALAILIQRFLQHGSQATYASMRCAETLGIRSMVQDSQRDGPSSCTWGFRALGSVQGVGLGL